MIVRAITKHPVCPAHPTMQVEIVYRYPAYEAMGGMWVCSACDRPLGAASFGGLDAHPPFPPRRRPRPSDPPYSVLDWDWLARDAL